MLTENILLLRERFPEVRYYFREFENEIATEKIDVIDSKTNAKTIRYLADDKKTFMIHSLYDPIREAERIILTHKEKIKKDSHVFFYGIGMGYHIEKFHELFPENSYSLYEPIPEIFLAMSKISNLDSIITKKTNNLYIDMHGKEATEYLEEFVTRNQSMHIIYLPSYENIFKINVNKFRNRIKNAIVERHTNLLTNTNYQKIWIMNSLLNFKEVLETPNMLRDIDRKQFEGKPVIIVSAGPSLAEDIEHLRYIKKNNLAYLFAVGSAINSLIEYDVLPDVVCTYDPGVKNHLVFEKMIEKGINSIPMLFGSSVGYETIRKYTGPKVHFITSQDRTSIYLLKNQLELNKDIILDSPSIAVMTFQVLNKLGASPIIFAGQNLGYLYDRRYSEGIEYNFIQSKVSEEENEKAITTTDVYGNQIKTNLMFNNMRINIEKFARHFGGVYINTTKGGALIEGVPFKPIESLIGELLTKPIKKECWWQISSEYIQSEIETQIENLKESNTRYHEIMLQIRKVLDAILKNTKIQNKARTNLNLTKFDNLYNRLIDNTYYKNFLSFYIRVQAEFLGNEIKRLNQESDIFIIGNQIVRLFGDFMKKCEQENEQLEKLITTFQDEILL